MELVSHFYCFIWWVYFVQKIRLSIDNNIKYESYRNNSYTADEKVIVEIKTSIDKDTDFLVKTFPFQELDFQNIVMQLKI